MKKQFISLFFALVFSMPLVVALSACTPVKATRGNLLTEVQVQKITAGTSTREDVLSAWGPPTVVAPFDNDTWYYIGERTSQEGVYAPVVLKQKIVCVKFDRSNNDTVASVSEISPQEARNVVPVSQTTPTAGKDYTLFQQFVGNIGRYNGATQTNQ